MFELPKKTLGIALILFLAGSTAAASTIPDSLTLEQVVPSETVVFVKCSGIEQWREDGRALDLMRLWQDPEIQALFADARKMLPELLGGNEMGDLPIKEFWNLFKGEVAFAATPRVTVFREGAAPSMALGLDMGRNKEKILGMLNHLMAQAAAEMGLETGKLEHRGFEIHYVGRPRDRWMICHTTLKNLFVATFNKYFLNEIIDCHLDGKPVLASSEAFHRSLKKVGAKGASALAYVNLQPFSNVLEPFWPYEVAEWMDMLGLKKVNALCLATTLEGGASRDSLFIDCPGKKKGLLKVLAPRPVSWDNIRQAFPDAFFFADIVIDPELFLEELDQFVREVVPEHYKEFRIAIGMVKKETGFDLEKDILGPLGQEVSVFVSPPLMGPNMIATVDLDDAEGFNALLEKLFAAMAHEGLRISESNYLERTFRTVTIPEEGVPVAPTFAVANGRLIVTSTPMTMKKYLSWLDKDLPGLADSPDFKEAVASVPRGASMLSYLNIRQFVEMGYGTAAPFLPSLFAEAELPMDPGKLPMTDDVTKYISNAVSYMVSDEDGILLGLRCPMGAGAALSVAVTALDYLVEENLVHGLPRLMGMGHMGDHGITMMPKASKKKSRGSELDAAYGIMQAGEHEIAEQIITSWLESHKDNESTPRALLNRGFCRLKLKKYEEGIEDYKLVAEKYPKDRPLALYNIACGLALMDKTEKAFAYLKKCVDAGWQDLDYLYQDSDLEKVRAMPEFKTWIEKIQ